MIAPRAKSGSSFVGSGGANDVASRAAACVVIVLAKPERLVERVGYVTSPGRTVESIATDLGVLRRRDGIFRIDAVTAGSDPVEERVKRFRASCGWDVEVSVGVQDLAPACTGDVIALRRYDPEGLFLN